VEQRRFSGASAARQSRQKSIGL
jgi:homoserine dehydrogenase